MEHIELPEKIARALARHLPPSVDVYDLSQSGMLGLIEAADRFLPDRQVKFRSYATPFIRGRMLKSLVGERAHDDCCISDLEFALPDRRELRPADAAFAAEIFGLICDGLSSADQQLVIAYFFENLTVQEIAAMVGRSCSAVGQRLQGRKDRNRQGLLQHIAQKLQGLAADLGLGNPKSSDSALIIRKRIFPPATRKERCARRWQGSRRMDAAGACGGQAVARSAQDGQLALAS